MTKFEQIGTSQNTLKYLATYSVVILENISHLGSVVRGCYFNSITSVMSFEDQGQEVVDFCVNIVFSEANINLITDVLIFLNLFIFT